MFEADSSSHLLGKRRKMFHNKTVENACAGMHLHDRSCGVCTDKHGPSSKLSGRFSFALANASDSKKSRTTKKLQSGRQNEKPVSNLFLQ